MEIDDDSCTAWVELNIVDKFLDKLRLVKQPLLSKPTVEKTAILTIQYVMRLM